MRINQTGPFPLATTQTRAYSIPIHSQDNSEMHSGEATPLFFTQPFHSIDAQCLTLISTCTFVFFFVRHRIQTSYMAQPQNSFPYFVIECFIFSLCSINFAISTFICSNALTTRSEINIPFVSVCSWGRAVFSYIRFVYHQYWPWPLLYSCSVYRRKQFQLFNLTERKVK